jgi:hypothetical protein
MYEQAFSKLPSVDLDHQIHLNRYIKFIESRPIKKYKSKFGLARHHICPKSFGMDKRYSKESWNIIILTEREHFIAHLILYKCYGDKMAQAFHMMNKSKISTGSYRNLTSRQFEVLSMVYSYSKASSMIGTKNPMYGKNPYDYIDENDRVLIHEKLSKERTGNKNPMYGKNPYDFMSEETKNRRKKEVSILMMGNKPVNSKKVVCITTNETFNSILEASTTLNIPRSSIRACCQNKNKSAGKTINGEKRVWKYL